jgi:hypothetical protein
MLRFRMCESLSARPHTLKGVELRHTGNFLSLLFIPRSSKRGKMNTDCMKKKLNELYLCSLLSLLNLVKKILCDRYTIIKSCGIVGEAEF